MSLHRANCSLVKNASTKRTHWTTGGRFKGCSLDRQELVDWVLHELGQSLERCADCSPETELPAATNGDGHLSRLAAEILDYVLESATIHLDEDSAPYVTTIGAVAIGIGKSPRQIEPALKRLFDGGYLIAEHPVGDGKSLHVRDPVYPTPGALRTLPYYHEWADEDLNLELAKLRGDASTLRQG
jgi:DNA-binding transcriptional ArsR family regulator